MLISNVDLFAIVSVGAYWLLGVAAIVAGPIAMTLGPRKPRQPKPYRGRHRPTWLTRLVDAYLTGAREMATAYAVLKGDQAWT